MLLTALAAIAALDVALFAWYLKATIIRQPFWDMYSWVLHYLDYRAAGGWWTYLWASHDVHRQVWIRLLTALDIEIFSGVSYPFIVFATTLHVMTAWLLWRESRRGVPGDLGQAIGYLVLMLVLTSVSAVDCAIPIANGYLHVLAAVVLTIVLFDGAGDRPAPDKLVYWRRGAALVAAITAPFASAVGWTVWPILLWLAWRGRAGRWWIVAVALSGVALLAIYFHDLSIAVGAGTATGQGVNSVAQLLARLDYLLTYTGLPWTRAAALAVPGRICGLLLLLAGSWVVVSRGLLRSPGSRLDRIAVALVMFSLASALLAAVGRAGVTGHDDVLVPARYSVLMTPLHVGLLWLATPVLTRLWNEGRSRSFLGAGLVVASLLLLGQQVAAGQAAAARTMVMRAAIDRFLAGGTDSEIADVVFVDPDQARRELEIMRRAGVYLTAK